MNAEFVAKIQDVEHSAEIVGTMFQRQGRKHPPIEIVVNVYKTMDLMGSIVKWRYVTAHSNVLGQTVYDYDVLPVTIARADIIQYPDNT